MGSSPASRGGNHKKERIPGDGDHWDPSQRLSSTGREREGQQIQDDKVVSSQAGHSFAKHA